MVIQGFDLANFLLGLLILIRYEGIKALLGSADKNLCTEKCCFKNHGNSFGIHMFLCKKLNKMILLVKFDGIFLIKFDGKIASRKS